MDADLRPLAVPTRLVRVPLDGSPAPDRLLASFADDRDPVALVGAWAGGGAVLASEPLLSLPEDADPFAALAVQPSVEGAGGGAVGGGWFGYLGYPLAGELERLPQQPPSPVALPPFVLAFHDHVVRLDSRTGRWWFEALVSPGREFYLDRRLEVLAERVRCAAGRATEDGFECGRFHVCPSPDEHRAAVARCVSYIVAGDIFQSNICLRLEAAFTGRPDALFRRGQSRLQPPYAAYVAGDWGAVCSLSPELFLRRRGRLVSSAPIKGTALRSDDPVRAGAQRDALVASSKDRAENVMIVDLMRSDLGRVCMPGSVHVPSLVEVQEHPGVWHLVSTVEGSLTKGVDDGELLRATFPPGSVTGAPKVRAMEIIAELERTGREVYTGAIGYASPVAGLELNVAIRTFEIAAGTVWLGVGGGIVADSRPDDELAECFAKGEPLLRAIGAELAVDPSDAEPAGATRQ